VGGSAGVRATGPVSRRARLSVGAKDRTATSAMSRGSIVEIGTSGNCARTRSPSASWSFQRGAFVMKLFGRRKVQAIPERSTAASEAKWYAATALSVSVPTTELLDSRTTCPTPASRAADSSRSMPSYPLSRKRPVAPIGGCTRRYSRDMDTAERLIRSTQELLWERGYVGTSPKAIQKAADAGQGSMYHHFSGKADLALAAITRSAEELRDVAEEHLGGDGPASARITAYLERDRDVLRGCRIGRLTSDPDVMDSSHLRAPVDETFRWLRQRLAEVIVEGQRAGEYPERLDADQVAATIAAVLQGGYVLARAAGSNEPFHQAIRGLISLLPDD